MRKLIFILVFCSSVIFINSVFSLQSWAAYVSAQNVKKHDGRAAKYDRLFWSPNEVSIIIKKDNALVQSQSRALVVPPAKNQTKTLVTSTKLDLKKSRTDDSRSIERKYENSHSEEESDEVSYERHYKKKHRKKKKKKKKHHLMRKRKKKFKKKIKVRKKYKKFLMPLLIAYKLKFFTLVPVFIAGLFMLVKTAGLAGFFFALFSAVMGLKGNH